MAQSMKTTGAMAIKANSPMHRVMRLGAAGAFIPRADGALSRELTATDTQLRSMERLGLAKLEKSGFQVAGATLTGHGLRRLAELDAEAEREARLEMLRAA